MCESNRSPKSAAARAAIAAKNAEFTEWAGLDRAYDARGTYLIGRWLEDLKDGNRLPSATPWAGQLPGVVRQYLDEVHEGEQLQRFVMVTADGTVSELRSGKGKRPYVLGRVLYRAQPVVSFAAPEAETVVADGNVT